MKQKSFDGIVCSRKYLLRKFENLPVTERNPMHLTIRVLVCQHCGDELNLNEKKLIH